MAFYPRRQLETAPKIRRKSLKITVKYTPFSVLKKVHIFGAVRGAETPDISTVLGVPIEPGVELARVTRVYWSGSLFEGVLTGRFSCEERQSV